MLLPQGGFLVEESPEGPVSLLNESNDEEGVRFLDGLSLQPLSSELSDVVEFESNQGIELENLSPVLNGFIHLCGVHPL